jgi:hypothetical protein
MQVRIDMELRITNHASAGLEPHFGAGLNLVQIDILLRITHFNVVIIARSGFLLRNYQAIAPLA